MKYLEDTAGDVIPGLEIPNGTPLVAAHGNSIRAIVRYLEDIADDVIPGLEIPIDTPLVYEVKADLKPFPNEFFVAAHGNSIRAIVKYLEDIADDVIPGLEIPSGTPWSTSSMPPSSRFRMSFRRGSWQFHPCHHEVLGGYYR